MNEVEHDPVFLSPVSDVHAAVLSLSVNGTEYSRPNANVEI